MPINVPEYKRILYIDLESQEAYFKNNQDLWEYLGGIGVSYKLLLDNLDSSPKVLSTGPLSGVFPYASKAHFTFFNNGRLIEKYGGGSVAGLLNISGVDAVVFLNNTEKVLSISITEDEVIVNEESEARFLEMRKDFAITKEKVDSLDYFSFGDFENSSHGIEGSVALRINSSVSLDLKNYYDYEKIYNEMIEEYRKVIVEPRNNPSCFGCPLGCDFSSEGEDDKNAGILSRCLISCAYAVEIYKDIPTVYACLNSIGYNYHHSVLESIPSLIGETRLNLIDKINTLEP